MCGIVAVLRLGERPLPGDDAVRAMTRAIAHRGPDGEGFHRDDDVALGVVRLAVVDVGHGRQPARGCRGAGPVSVVNGELYEHRPLRAELAARHEIVDACDATLLPHLYEDHGANMVLHMHGMFAFALWDRRERTLLLGRDRLGIKPLFFAVTPDFLVAASEAKAIFASGLVQPRIDRDAVDDLFSLGYPCPPRTMFAGVTAVPPGHTVTARAGGGAQRGRVDAARRYWRAPLSPPAHTGQRGSPAGSAADVHDALAAALRTHLDADVPVATWLSGGLDSSAVSALAREAAGAPLPAFALTFPGDPEGLDESAPARAVARFLGADLDEVPMGAPAASLLERMTWHLELPLLVPGALGGLLLSERQRARGFKVTLTGDGADEVLGGYDVFRASRARRLLGARAFSAAVVAGDALGLLSPRGIGAFLAQNARAPRTDIVARAYGGVRPPWLEQWALLDVERAALLSPDGRRVRPIEEAPAGFAALVREDAVALDPLDAEIALELETRLPAWILVIGDRSSMAHGVEARLPFLDDDVVRTLLAVRPALKMRGMREKAVLRDAVAGLLPRAIVRRRKQPFMTPIAPWFFPPGATPPALTRARLEDAGLFDAAVVARLLTRLHTSRPGTLERVRLEMVLMLVLGTQLLHASFVARA